MQLYEMQVTKTAIIRTAPARIPKGIIGAAVRLSFSPEWEGLHKTVVFRAGNVTKDVLDVENEVVIPAECTEEVGALLEVGVYGVDGENSVAIPTLWAAIGRVCEATDPSGDTTTDPSLPVWAQLLDMIRQLEEQGVTQNEVDRAVQDYFGANPVTAQSIGAAPAGYGYGDLISIAETGDAFTTALDNLLTGMGNGFAKQLRFSADSKYTFGMFFYGTLSKHTNDYAVLTGRAYDGCKISRVKYDGAWQPWEYVNPPMELWEEYRTTERFDGKPVYTKLVDCLNLPNASTSNVQHGISGITQVIRCIGQNVTNGESIPARYNDNYTEIFANDTYVYIYSSFNASSFTANAQLWYTKD